MFVQELDKTGPGFAQSTRVMNPVQNQTQPHRMEMGTLGTPITMKTMFQEIPGTTQSGTAEIRNGRIFPGVTNHTSRPVVLIK